jgi:hypothetical protein
MAFINGYIGCLYVDTSDSIGTKNINVGISFTQSDTQTHRHTDTHTQTI